MPDENGNPLPWERQKGETSKAFAAFTAYRDLGPTRSFLRVADVYRERGQRGGEGMFKRWSADWDWVERAAQWDDYADSQRRERDAIEEAEARKQHRVEIERLGRGMMTLGGRWLALHADRRNESGELVPAKKKADDLTAGEVARLVDVGSRLALLMMGEATERTDFRGADAFVAKLMQIALRYVPDGSVDAFLGDMDAALGTQSFREQRAG